MHAVLALAALASCGPARKTLSPCWRAVDLRQGERFFGTVLINAGYDQRSFMSPVSCDGSVVADLPDGVVFPA
jgi:hypothetical protein